MISSNRKASWHLGATITTAFSMALVLLMLGAMASVSIVALKLSKQVQESAGLSLSIANNVMPDQLDSISASIEQQPYVAHTHVVTRSEALQQWKNETGEDLVELLGENPLNATVEVNVKRPWASSDSLAAIKQSLEQLPGVIDVATSQRQVDNIMNNAHHLLNIIAVSTAILLIVALALIASLVRLQTYSQRFHIHTMTLVGAKTWFIVRPYMLRGAAMGLGAAIVASLVILAVWMALCMSHDPFYHAVSVCLPHRSIALVMAMLAIVGVTTGAVATAIAAKHYTRVSHEELYAE